MKIIIDDKRKIFAIQEEFSRFFPYLKIEFFSKPHRSKGESSKKIVSHGNKVLGECRVIHTKGAITISPQMTVADLEQHFADVYGLSIRIVRNSGKAWLETTLTEGWTLEEQNKQGQALSS